MIKEEKISVKEVCDNFKCKKTQVYDIIKSEESIKIRYLLGHENGLNKRKARETDNKNFNSLVLNDSAQHVQKVTPFPVQFCKNLLVILQKNWVTIIFKHQTVGYVVLRKNTISRLILHVVKKMKSIL